MTQVISDADRDLYLRSPRQGVRVYMSVYAPSTAWEGVLVQAPSLAGRIFVTTTSGLTTNVLEGYTISAYSVSTGQFKGWLRCRESSALDGQIFVMEIGGGYSDLGPGDILKATPFRRPIAKFQRYNTATTQWVADFDLPLDDKNTYIGPLSRVGPPAIGFRDGGGQATLKFVGDRSETYTDGGAISDYLWSWPESNTSSSAGSSGTPNEVAFDDPYPGGAEYTLTTTDNQGQQHTRYGVLWTHDREGVNAPYSVAQVDISSAQGQGGVAQAFLYGQHSEDALPVGAYIVLWAEVNYGGTIVDNVGGTYPYRSNILFAGYIVEETRNVVGKLASGEIMATEIKAATADEVHRQMATYPVVQESVTGTPDDWNEIKNLTVDRGIASLVKWRLLADMSDVYTSDYGGDQPINFLDPPAGTIWQQLEYMGPNTIAGIVGVSLGGDVYINADYQITPDTGQWSLLPALNIEQADLIGPVIIQDSSGYQEISLVRTSGVDVDTALYSQSPGDVRGYMGGNMDQPPGYAPNSQVDLNETTGKMRTYHNRKIKSVDFTTSFVHFDANPQAAINLTIPASDDPRSDAFASGLDMMVTRTRLSFNVDLSATTSFTCEPVTRGSRDGVTVIMPQTPVVNPGNYAQPPSQYDAAYAELPTPGTPISSAQAGDLMAMGDGGGSALTPDIENALAGGIVSYEQTGVGLPADALIINSIFLAGEQTAYACVQSGSIETAGVYKRVNAWNPGSSWVLEYSEADFIAEVVFFTGYADNLEHIFGGIGFSGENVYVNCAYVSEGVAGSMDVDPTVSSSGNASGVIIPAGATVNFTAFGEWFIGGVDPGPWGPDGDPARPNGPILNTAPVASLIGRIGAPGPFLVGSAASVVAAATGELVFRINDDFLGDNSGSVNVTFSAETTSKSRRRFLVLDGSAWTLRADYTEYDAINSPGNLSAFAASAGTGFIYVPRYDFGYKIAKSSNLAVTFSNIDTVNTPVLAYNIPFEANADDSIQWIGGGDGTVKRATDKGVTFATITMPGGWVGNVSDQSIHSYTSDSDIMTIANENAQVATSQDGNAVTPTFTVKTPLAAAPYFVGGWPDDPLWLAVASDIDVQLTTDGAVTWHSAIGNLAALGWTTIRWVIPRFSV